MVTNQTLLIVDDDKADLDFFCGAIEISSSAVCQNANDCGEARENLRHGTDVRPDFIFLAMNMPKMGSRECLVELKKNSSLKDIPVISYTTSSYRHDKDETLANRAAYFFTKAYAIGTLREGIAKMIETVSSN